MKLPKIKFPWKKEKPQISDLRVVFMGSGEFAVSSLKQILDFERLLSAGKIVLAVFTQPDKSIGRSKKISKTPVKELALKYKVPVLEPDNLKSSEWLKKIQDLRPDLIIVCDYGKIIPADILDIPKFGCINIHPSLLPKYRGSTPVQQAILNGDSKTGVTIMLLDEKLDHGPILKQKTEKIRKDETYESLLARLADIGGRMLIEFLPDFLNGKFTPKEQDHKKAVITRELIRENGKIDWEKEADEIERMGRAYMPWPGIWTRYNGKILKIQVKKCQGRSNCKIDKELKPGAVFLTVNKELGVVCGKGVLIIDELQIEGKKAMGSEEFLRGNGKIVGSTLG